MRVGGLKFMRKIKLVTLLAAVLLPATAAQAADCAALKIVDRIQMMQIPGDNRDVMPVLINGQPEQFMFDTGGERTQISRAAATRLKLPILQTNFTMMGLDGKVNRDGVSIQQLQIGRMNGKNVTLPIASILADGGLVALEVLRTSDIDVDFGTDTMNMFSTDHCDGAVVYWKAPVTATVPIVWHGYHMSVPVTLDGHQVQAWIDTGAAHTDMFMDRAKSFYNLTMGDADTPENANGNANFKNYSHTFKSLSFGSITVNNPLINIIPNTIGRDLSRASMTDSRAKSERDMLDLPDMIIGMDVLRKLHIYIATKENRLYISDATVQTPEVAAEAAALRTSEMRSLFHQHAILDIQNSDAALAAAPQDAAALNNRCFARAVIKVDLDKALDDCDQAIKLKPSNAPLLDSRAFVLYQQGKFQDALQAYNAALAVNDKLAPSLLMRGYTKGKLGDAAGKDADIAAAAKIQPNVANMLLLYDVSL